jgi:proteic killer suppression protein
MFPAKPRGQLDRLHTTHVTWNRAVIQSFGDDTTADLFRERNTRDARRIPREIWRIVQRKLKIVDVAARLEDLAIPAGNRLQRLKGDQAGRYSMRVNVTFRWEQGHAYEVRVEDYH